MVGKYLRICEPKIFRLWCIWRGLLLRAGAGAQLIKRSFGTVGLIARRLWWLGFRRRLSLLGSLVLRQWGIMGIVYLRWFARKSIRLGRIFCRVWLRLGKPPLKKLLLPLLLLGLGLCWLGKAALSLSSFRASSWG
jgi:hypothetical protein